MPSLYNWADIIYDLHTVGYNWADIIQYIYNYTIGQISYDIYNWADMIQLGRYKTWDIDSRFLSDVNVKLPLSITSMSSGPSSINGQIILLHKSIVLEKEWKAQDVIDRPSGIWIDIDGNMRWRQARAISKIRSNSAQHYVHLDKPDTCEIRGRNRTSQTAFPETTSCCQAEFRSLKFRFPSNLIF